MNLFVQSRFNLVFIPFIVLSIGNKGTEAFKENNFKRCDQSAFCQRQRNYNPTTTPYIVNFESLQSPSPNQVTLDVTNTENKQPFILDIFALEDGMFRVKINEASPLKSRYEVPDIIKDVKTQKFFVNADSHNQTVTLMLTDNPNLKIKISCRRFQLDVFDVNEPIFSLNSRNLLHIEHLRKKMEPKLEEKSEIPNEVKGDEEAENKDPPEEVDGKVDEKSKEEKEDADDLPGMWEETFNGHQDSKPRGPESIGLDTSFINFAHVYGIPEHAERLALKSTVGAEPYRLYNLDVFEYELGSRAALYGSIPLMIGHNAKRTVGLLWLNSAETWVDVDSSEDNKGVLGTVYGYFAGQDAVPEVNVHWMSESGVVDVYFMLGPSPSDVMRQYTKLTGTTYLPPKWAVAYHQSRWNYKDTEDVKTVDQAFDEHDIPYDCLWLDIEHTDGKRYFTWDDAKFPNPVEMQNALAAKGRKMVTIIDPHIKVDSNYHIYREARAKGYFIKDKNGAEFKGSCWPGDSAYLDFTLPEVRHWWASQFMPDRYKGSTLNLFTWNDMNEPSVFSGPEITMHKDIQHGGGWEHRHVHNLYGILQMASTVEGQIERSGGNERSFVLSRAFFVGTQQYGAIWTGDNTADWGHLEYSTPMLLTIGLCGISHSGADIGGFFNNPNPELLTRWYQTAVYQPFVRAHAHIDTARREPWLVEDIYKDAIRSSLRERYELMPFWYTLFYQSHKTGAPPMRPLWYEFPTDASLFSYDKAFMVGSSLLVQPVVGPGIDYTSVYLPGTDGWYDIKTYQHYSSPNTVTLTTPLSRIAVLQRGGTIIPRKLRVRRCSALMTHDPYTLYVALNPQGHAQGEVYMDDGHTFEYKKGSYNYKNLTFENNQLSSKSIDDDAKWETSSWLERVEILGSVNPNEVTMKTGDLKTTLGFSFNPSNKLLIIRKPGVNMQKDWSITLS